MSAPYRSPAPRPTIATDDHSRRVPDNLALAAGALAGSLAAPILSASLLAASGGRLWVAFGAPVCAAVGLTRGLRARFGPATIGLDVRHAHGESARSMAVISLVYTAGVLALNGAMLAFDAAAP